MAIELQNQISLYKKNLEYTQKLQKCYHGKHARPSNYALKNKVWLNSKYIWTFLNTTPSSKTNLQARITQEMENS